MIDYLVLDGAIYIKDDYMFYVYIAGKLYPFKSKDTSIELFYEKMGPTHELIKCVEGLELQGWREYSSLKDITYFIRCLDNREVEEVDF